MASDDLDDLGDLGDLGILDIPPPPRPPPLLAPDAIHHLCAHGYLGLDLPPPLAAHYDRLLAAADAFFALPAADKDPWRPSLEPRGPLHRGPRVTPASTERGYAHVAGEKEFLTLRRSLTHLPPGIAAAAAPVWHDTAHLLQRILADVAVYLGMPSTGAWDAVVHDSLVPGDGVFAAADEQRAEGTTGTEKQPRPRLHPRDDPPTLLRLFRYEPAGGGAEQHRDLGLLTLCVCWGRGLQVRPQPPPGLPPAAVPWLDAPRVTVMAGDTLHLLAATRIPSAVHRVVVVPDRASDAASDPATPPDGRRSIVFALRATVAGDIDLAALGGEGSVGAKQLSDHIRQRRVNINADRQHREEMRAQYRRACAERQAPQAPQATGEDAEDDETAGDLAGVA